MTALRREAARQAAKIDARSRAGRSRVASGDPRCRASPSISRRRSPTCGGSPPSKRALNLAPRPAPIARQRIADDADALTASKYGAEPAPTAWDIGQEQEAEQTFLRRGLSSDILKKLRRGHWALQGEIDLHGHTIDEAHDALSDFIVEARQRGYRCVRAIHGKGLTSPNREPVLKGRVRQWLAHWDEVLAYCEAPPNAGGGGAVLILLRGK